MRRLRDNLSVAALPLLVPLMAGSEGEVKPAQDKPNILIIMADDCSWNDIGCFGSQNHATPNIDALSADGLLFTQGFNSATTSVPTRHALYTGMFPYHNGGYYNLGLLGEGVKTMPVYMQELGYRCGLAGKWHIWPESAYPWENVPGFQKSCVSKDVSYTLDGVREFMTRSGDEPFCLMLASINPHMPWTGGDPSVYDRDSLVLPPIFADTPLTREYYARYLAEIDRLDKEVGDLIGILKENGLYDNTLILFLSEQGSQLTGAKWTCWSQGVHAGIIARWPGHTHPGTVTDAIVQYEDILPTLLDLAGGSRVKELDGRSLRRLLDGRTGRHRRYAYHFHANIPSGPAYSMRACSDGRYRLIWNLSHESEYRARNHDKAPWFREWKQLKDDSRAQMLVNRWHHRPEFELYDTLDDPWELNNLAGSPKHRGVQRRLYRQIRHWMRSQGDPGIPADKEMMTGPQYEKSMQLL